jgi:hypothetical protein
MSVVDTEIPTFYILVEGYTDQGVLGVLLGSVGFTYVEPQRRSSDVGPIKPARLGEQQTAAQLDSQFSHLRGDTLGATVPNHGLHDKAVVGIAHAVLDPRRQYESAFRDSPVWKDAILNPEGPFAPLLEFLRTTLQPDA